jgi:superfamily II DNA or RNA helicase
MFKMRASNYWEDAILWMKTGNAEQRKAGLDFYRAVTNRKNFLWTLSSTREISLRLKRKILEDERNKVLLFSQLTEQASTLSKYTIHSNVGKTAKETLTVNSESLRRFNENEIRELSSVRSLTLGLNLVGANHAIFESYDSSDVSGKQKAGRLHRLPVDEMAKAIILKVVGTQCETWFTSAFPFIKNPRIIKSVDEL